MDIIGAQDTYTHIDIHCVTFKLRSSLFHWSLLYIKIDASAQFISVILKGYSGIYKIRAELI